MRNQELRREIPTSRKLGDTVIHRRHNQHDTIELARRKARQIARQASYRTNPERVLAHQDDLAEEFALELAAVMGGTP